MEINKKKTPRKPCLTAIVLSLLITSEAFADATARDLMSLCGMQGPCADAVVGQLAHDNASSITFSNAAGNDTIPILGVDSSDETVIRTDAGDYLKINIAEDAQRIYSINATSDTAFSITWGDGGTTATQDLVISGSTSDADDDSSLFLAGGGSNSTSRGGIIEIDGNEDGNKGDVTVDSGDATGSDVVLRTNASNGVISFKDSTNTIMAQFIQTAGGLGLSFSAGYGLKMAAYVPTMATTPVAGTNDFKIGMNAVPTAAAATGALLPASPTQGDIVEIMNTMGNEVQIFPGSGDTINGGSANTVVGLGALMRATCVANSASAWVCFVPVAAAIATPGA